MGETISLARMRLENVRNAKKKKKTGEREDLEKFQGNN